MREVSGHVRSIRAQSPRRGTNLGGGVDLGLPSVLALAEHGGGHELVAVLAGDEVGRLEEDGRPVVPGESLPVSLSGNRRLNRLGDELRSGDVVAAKGLLGVSMGLELLKDVASLDLRKGEGEGSAGLQEVSRSKNTNRITASFERDARPCRQ